MQIDRLLLEGFRAEGVKGYVSAARKKAAIPFYIVCLCIAVAIVGSVIGWKLFRARAYSELLPIENGDFAADVAEISFDQIPMLDSASANVLANRKLGELSDLVSQFEIYDDSFQINYQNRPVRVTYLNYGDFFKWWNNQKAGIPAYMVIDMVTQEVTVQRLEEGIKYSPSEYFFRDIDRYLRFKYPTKMFTDVNFEVNEEGEPYWVATVVTKKVGLFGGEGGPTVMAHCVLSEQPELELIRERGVYIAHCPASNMNVSSGIAPVRRFLDMGLHTGLGSDVAGGTVTSIFRAMADAIQVSKLRWRLVDGSLSALTAPEAFHLGTAGGGELFNTGSFRPGREFDAIVMDDRRYSPPGESDIPSRLERTIYLSDDRDIEHKFVRGRRLF